MEKLEVVHGYFNKQIFDYGMISKECGFTREHVRQLHIKFQSIGNIFEDKSRRKPKLSQIHMDFIETYFNTPAHFGNSLFDLHDALTTVFNLAKNFITVRSLYNNMKRIRFTYKKIIYKVNNANTTRIKDMRKNVAIEILTAHLKGFHFLYIDEISFNLELRPNMGWSLVANPI